MNNYHKNNLLKIDTQATIDRLKAIEQRQLTFMRLLEEISEGHFEMILLRYLIREFFAINGCKDQRLTKVLKMLTDYNCQEALDEYRAKRQEEGFDAIIS